MAGMELAKQFPLTNQFVRSNSLHMETPLPSKKGLIQHTITFLFGVVAAHGIRRLLARNERDEVGNDLSGAAVMQPSTPMYARHSFNETEDGWGPI